MLRILITLLLVFHLGSTDDCDYEKFRTITCKGITTDFLFNTGLFTAKHMYRQFICIGCNLGDIPAYTFNVKDSEGDRASFIILDLTSSNITGLQNKTFFGQELLRKLILRNNSIAEIVGPFQPLTHLEFLDLAFNKIEILKANSFGGLLHLSVLDLESNRIGEIEAGAFSDLENLQILKLDHNRIKLLDGDAFSGLLAIESLSLSFNALESMNYKALANFSYLFQLNLENNRLKEIPEDLLKNGKKLKQLDISSNPLEVVASRNLASDSLEELFIRNCSLPMVRNLLVNLPNLRMVDLSSNTLTEVNLDSFAKSKYLTALNLSDNSISHIDCSNISLPFLRTLDLSNNEIADFDYVSILGNLPELKGINFFKNPLPSYLQKEIIEYLYGISSSANYTHSDKPTSNTNTTEIPSGVTKVPMVIAEWSSVVQKLKAQVELISLKPIYGCFGAIVLILIALAAFLYKVNVGIRNLDNAVKGSTVPLLDV